MIVKRWLARPRWEHRNVGVRQDAVAQDDLQSLAPLLPNIARNDDDCGVRIAALRRCADLALAQERAIEDPDTDARAAAKTLYLDLLSGAHPASPSLADRLRLLSAIDDKSVWTHLLREGTEPELREAALDRDPRPGLLTERILEDPDPALRLRLLSHVDNADTLQRIADQSRRRDKRLHRAARERVNALRLATGDQDAMSSTSEQICRRLELGASKAQISVEALDAIDHEWCAVEAQAAPAVHTRYAHARAQYQAALAATRESATRKSAPATAQAVEPELMHPSASVDAAGADVQRLAAEARFKSHVATSVGQAEPRPRADPARDAGIEHRLQQLEQALEDGELRAALDIEQALAGARIDGGKFARRLHHAHLRIAELQRWQQWSTRRQRRQLCTDAANLRDSGMHPDALATRVRELRAAWTKLDGLGTNDATQAATDVALNKRFEALCHRALKPARTYFEHRDTLRQEKSQNIRDLIAQATELDADNDDWDNMTILRRQLGAARRQLGDAQPRQRKQLASALQAALTALDERLASHHAGIETARKRLLTEADAIGALPSSQRARQVRELQAQWKQLGAGRPDLDRKQWRAFRSTCDSIFAGLDEQRQHEAVEREQNIESAHALVADLRALDSDSIDDMQRRHRKIDAQWRQLNVRDPQVIGAWRAAVTTQEQHVLALQQAARGAQFAHLPDILAGAKPTTELAAELNDALARRPSATTNVNDARDVLVRLEALADIDSPECDRERRVELRLQRLQAVLGEGKRQDAKSDFMGLLVAWIELGAVNDDTDEIEQRFRHAFNAVLDKL